MLLLQLLGVSQGTSETVPNSIPPGPLEIVCLNHLEELSHLRRAKVQAIGLDHYRIVPVHQGTPRSEVALIFFAKNYRYTSRYTSRA